MATQDMPWGDPNGEAESGKVRQRRPAVTSVNKRVPLPLAALAPVTHGPGAYRSPVQCWCNHADGCGGTDVWLGHVGTL